MICPLKFNSRTLGGGGYVMYPEKDCQCVKEKCALWVKYDPSWTDFEKNPEKGNCAILDIALSLTEIRSQFPA